MDFFTTKELNGLKGDLKSSQIALAAEKENFQKQLLDFYASQINEALTPKKQETQSKNTNKHKKIKDLFKI